MGLRIPGGRKRLKKALSQAYRWRNWAARDLEAGKLDEVIHDIRQAREWLLDAEMIAEEARGELKLKGKL
jgi:hypothetical protein